MDVFELESLASLREEQARRLDADARNRRVARVLLTLALAPSIVAAASTASGGPEALLRIALPFAVLGSLAVVQRAISPTGPAPLLARFDRPARWLTRQGRWPILTGFLLAVGCIHLLSDGVSNPEPALILPPWIVLALRLELAQRCLVHVVLWLPSLRQLVDGSDGVESRLVPVTAFVGVLTLGLGALLERRFRADFSERWGKAMAASGDRLRMRRELEAAREVQLAMLPDAPPERPWLRIAASSLPAAEVGGDYWDVFEPDGERLVIAVGDVAGHGLPAGLALAGLRAGLTLLRERLHEPASVLGELDRLMRETTRGRLLATLALVDVEPGGERLLLAQAGHPPILRRSARDGTVEWIGTEALPLGTRLPSAYRTVEVDLEPGDIVVIYSDGLVEALDAEDRPWGFDGLETALLETPESVVRSGASSVRDSLLRAVGRHADGRPLQDDRTVVVLERIADRQTT